MNQKYQAVSVQTLPGRRVQVCWGDGHRSEYHYVWLRHASYGAATPEPPGADLTFRRLDDPAELAVENCRVHNDELSVSWANDATTTHHDLAWLRDNCYSAAERERRRLRPQLWDGAAITGLPWFDYQSLDADDALWDVFAAVRDHGLARVRNLPVSEGSVGEFARRFGPIRETHFGRVFDVLSRPREQGVRVNIGATSTRALAPHTDEGWRHMPIGVSLFHCIEPHPRGEGASVLVDGFNAAERLRRRSPQAFDFLTRHPAHFAAERNDDERFRAHGRLICTSPEGELEGVRFTDRTLAPQDLPAELVEPFYAALRDFATELYAPELAYEHCLAAGECFVYDNQRVLHSRNAFDPAAGTRHMQQCSVDRDEFHNRLRLLAVKLGRHDDAMMRLPGGALG